MFFASALYSLCIVIWSQILNWSYLKYLRASQSRATRASDDHFHNKYNRYGLAIFKLRAADVRRPLHKYIYRQHNSNGGFRITRHPQSAHAETFVLWRFATNIIYVCTPICCGECSYWNENEAGLGFNNKSNWMRNISKHCSLLCGSSLNRKR